MPELEDQQTASVLDRITILLLSLSCAYTLSILRPLASDEGFYAIAAQEVLKGKHPYLDFFYPQAPVFPYVYAVWLALFGVSWVSARCCTAAFLGVLGLVLYQLLTSITSRLWAFLGLLMLFVSTLVLAWFPTVKFFTPTVFLLLCTLYCSARGRKTTQARYWLLAGICFGIACGIRSYVVLCIVPLLFLFETREDLFRSGRGFLLGLCLGLLPHALFFLLDYESYLYNNLFFHLQRSSLPDERIWPQKLMIVQRLFGFIVDRKTPDPQYGMLFVAASVTIFCYRGSLNRITRVSYGMALAMFLISLLPTPTWEQYFSITIPFLLIPAIAGAHKAWSSGSQMLRASCILLIGAYGVIGIGELHSYCAGTKRLPGPGNLLLTAEDGDELSHMIKQRSNEHSSIVSIWPGYLFGASRELVPGMENQFWVRVPESFPQEDRQRFHIMSRKKLQKILSSGRYEYVVTEKARRLTNTRLLKRAGYVFLDTRYGVYLWSYKQRDVLPSDG